MSNYIEVSLRVINENKEQREELLEVVKNTPIGDKYYCRYYDCSS